MKALARWMKYGSFLLASLVFLQGCTAYKGSISLENAVAGQQKVKVFTSDGAKPMEFQKIEYVEGEYRGLPKRYSQAEEQVLDPSKITRIKKHDKTTSNIVTFSPLVVIAALGIILFAGDGDGGF